MNTYYNYNNYDYHNDSNNREKIQLIPILPRPGNLIDGILAKREYRKVVKEYKVKDFKVRFSKWKNCDKNLLNVKNI